MEPEKRVVRGPHRIYLQTPENGAILLGVQEVTDNNNTPEICFLQGQEVYVLTNEEDVSSNCEENGVLHAVHSVEVHVNGERKNGTKGATQDEDLTPLSWLQNTNLLQNITLTTEIKKKAVAENKAPKTLESPQESDEAESSCDGSNHSSSEGLLHTQTIQNGEESASKPPHSFSTLIFLAIESSSTKALPVRDIYSWITQNFPYYRHAPVGWKNSVRHNLSLNKCFYKVEGGLNLTKGSFWMVDPAHRSQLIQSLCKVSYVKAELIQQLMKDPGLPSTPLTPLTTPTKTNEDTKAKPLDAANSSASLRPNPNLPDPKLFPFLSRRLAFNSAEGPDVEVDAATAMLALGQSCVKHFSDESIYKDDSRPASPPSHTSPVDDHTYSYAPRLLVQSRSPQKRLQGGHQKRERHLENYVITDHVPYVVRELEVHSVETSAPSPTKQARGEHRSASNGGRGQSRGRARGRGKRR